MARALAADDASVSAKLVAGLRPFATFAFVAILMGRAIGPSAAGSGVGVSNVINALQRVGAVLSQGYALFGTLMLLTLVFVVARSRLAPIVRGGSLSLGGLVALLVLAAAPSGGSPLSLLLLGVCAALLAFVAAFSVRRVPLVHQVAPALGAVAASSLLHLAAVTLMAAPPSRFAAFARTVATALSFGSVALDALAVGVAALLLSPDPKHGRLLRPATAIAVVAALVLTRHVLVAGADQGFVPVLVRRSIARLALDAGIGLAAARVFITSLAVIVAAAGLVRGATMPALSASLSMLVLVRSTPDAPLAGLTLALAALGAIVAAHDGRALWAELDKRGTSPRPDAR